MYKYIFVIFKYNKFYIMFVFKSYIQIFKYRC